MAVKPAEDQSLGRLKGDILFPYKRHTKHVPTTRTRTQTRSPETSCTLTPDCSPRVFLCLARNYRFTLTRVSQLDPGTWAVCFAPTPQLTAIKMLDSIVSQDHKVHPAQLPPSSPSAPPQVEVSRRLTALYFSNIRLTLHYPSITARSLQILSAEWQV